MVTAVAAAKPVPTEPLPFSPPAGWPSTQRPVMVISAVVPDQREPLPRPSITEPVSIGEALYDPARVADAVVSVLALMRIETIPDDATQVVIGRPHLSRAELTGRRRIRLTPCGCAVCP